MHLIVENKDKINDVMVALKLPQFKDIEIEFLEEYCLSLKPISNARIDCKVKMGASTVI